MTHQLLLLAGLLVTATSCNISRVIDHFPTSETETPSETIVTKYTEINDIHGIDTSSGIIVHYSQQPSSNNVKIEGPDNVIEALEIQSGSNGTLKLYFQNNKHFRFTDRKQHPHVWISTTDVTTFKASSGASILSDATVTLSKDITIEASSGAHISFDGLKAPSIDTDASSGAIINIADANSEKVDAGVSSGASIKISGKTSTTSLNASSGGSINASSLKAERGKSKASSGGSINCSIKNISSSKSSGGSIHNN